MVLILSLVPVFCSLPLTERELENNFNNYA